MQVFKTKAFARFARKEGISDAVLLKAVALADVAPDVDLGGGVIKQRVARSGQGKSGGYRTIVLYRRDDVAYFVHGYAKIAQSNILVADERAFKELAAIYPNLSADTIQALVEAGKIKRVVHDGSKQ